MESKSAETQKQKSNQFAIGCGTIIGVIIVIAAITFFTSSDDAPKTRKERMDSLFSAWDGSNTQLKQIVKESMNDPSSFEHDATRYSDEFDHLIVIMKYRGTNAFGGIVPGYVKAKVDTADGTVLEIIETAP